jgi:tRNA C32,U32 (ribose-2'-O)-methylase TrmJ
MSAPVHTPRVVLVRPKLDDNVGAAARAMKNFGLSELMLVAPRCRVGRQAYALASHAGDVLDAARTADADLILSRVAKVCKRINQSGH